MDNALTAFAESLALDHMELIHRINMAGEECE